MNYVPEEKLQFLFKDLGEEEVKQVMEGMAKGNTLDFDGLPSEFYTFYWPILGI